MQVTVEQLEPCKVAVNVEVDPEAVTETIDRVFREVARQIAVPGFRKGRAPRHILERFIDEGLIRDQAIQELVPEYFSRAIQEQGVEPFARPEFEFEADTLERAQPFRFSATVPTRPEVRLHDYHNLPAKRRKVEVTERDVELELDLLRQRAVRVEDVDAEVAGSGLIAIVDMDLFRGERQLKNRSRTNVPINMDDTKSVPAFNVEIEGMRLGESREMMVRFPDDHEDRVLAGKEIRFRITLRALKKAVLPELDDQFAKETGGVETLEELRAKAREEVEQAAREVADREVRDQVLEQVVSRSEVFFPEALVEENVADALREQTADLERRGLTLDEYLQGRGIDLATFERELRENTRRRIRTQLVLEEIAEKEQIEVSDEDVNEEIQRMAENAGVPAASLRALLERGDNALRGIRVQLLYRKVVDLLQQSAHVTEE